MSSWKAIIPTAATNMVLNPSAETTLNFAVYSASAVTRVWTVARFGDWSYFINASSTTDGITLTTAALANAVHYVTFYVYGTITGALQVSTDATNFNNAAIIGGSSGGWVRYGVSILAAQCNGSVALIIRDTLNEDWYCDGIQCEQSSYWTTYLDGDRKWETADWGGLYKWNGLRNASTSTRDAQERSGGRVMDLEDDYGFRVLQHAGSGMPPITHNLQGLSLQPGAAFQSTKVQPRTLYLTSETHDDTVAGLHSERKDIIDLMKPDAVRGAQPFVLGYAGANSGKTVWAAFRYADGLGFGQMSGGSMFLENDIPIQLLAVDPYWTEDNRETATLGFSETLTDVNYVLARINGLWQELGSGFNGTCWAIAHDPTTGRVYFGGDFSTANGVTVNGICYWNPTTATFVAMDGGVAAAGAVYTIAIAANGDVWVGGTFLTAGSALTACVGLARWNLATSTWTVPTATATSFVIVMALVIDRSGNLYGGGNFLNYSGNAACDYIFKYTLAGAFSPLGTGMNNIVGSLALARGFVRGTIVYVGGAFTTGNGVTLNRVGYWSDIAATFLPMRGGVDGTVNAIAVASNGDVYIGGDFNNVLGPTIAIGEIARWNGQGFSPLGVGITGAGSDLITTLYIGNTSLLYTAGFYETIGPFESGWPAIWNGSSWQLLDLNSAATAPEFKAFLVTPNGDLYAGHDTAGIEVIVASNTASSAIVATNTVSVYPTFTLTGPSTAGASLTLKSIKNLSTDQEMLFDLVITQGEVVRISLVPGRKLVLSEWSGPLPGYPLPSSDFASWKMLPTRSDSAATNNIAAFCTGTTTGAIFLMHWDVAHWSADGSAA